TFIAKRTDGTSETRRIRARGAEKDGLFRTSAGAANTPKLQNANRPHHETAVAAGGRTERCGAGDTSASARATSNTDATTNTASMPTARRGRARNAARRTRRQVAPAKLSSDAPISRSPIHPATNVVKTPAIPTP